MGEVGGRIDKELATNILPQTAAAVILRQIAAWRLMPTPPPSAMECRRRRANQLEQAGTRQPKYLVTSNKAGNLAAYTPGALGLASPSHINPLARRDGELTERIAAAAALVQPPHSSRSAFRPWAPAGAVMMTRTPSASLPQGFLPATFSALASARSLLTADSASGRTKARWSGGPARASAGDGF
jgi:hypothetical protein